MSLWDRHDLHYFTFVVRYTSRLVIVGLSKRDHTIEITNGQQLQAKVEEAWLQSLDEAPAFECNGTCNTLWRGCHASRRYL